MMSQGFMPQRFAIIHGVLGERHREVIKNP